MVGREGVVVMLMGGVGEGVRGIIRVRIRVQIVVTARAKRMVSRVLVVLTLHRRLVILL